MNTSRRGDRSEALVLGYFVDQGYDVLIPWGDSARYDLLIDHEIGFIRVQVKTARRGDGVVIFKCKSYTTRLGKASERDYEGGADVFAVYSPDLDEFFFVPVSHAPDVASEMSLRFEPAKNGQEARINRADDYRSFEDAL